MKSVLIVGSGKRVVEAALPVFLAAGDRFRIAGVFSRKAKRIESAGRSFDVRPLELLDQGALTAADAVYMVVAKDATPAVLKQLTRHDVSSVDLLIDTPVLRFKLLGHRALLERFRATWVTEDCARLPIFETVAAFRAQAGLGPLRRVTFDRSAYAYHGVAMGRELLGAGRVRSARRQPLDGSLARRTVRFRDGGELVIVEPRDYSVGRILLEAAEGTISDAPDHPFERRLAAVVEAGACTGFRIGDTVTALNAAERALMGEPGAGEGVTAWMEGMKRVGFLRLLGEYDDGRGAYGLERALEDTVVDYHLEKFGRYVANPLTSPHFSSSRLVMRWITRLAER
jgi:hypothetical protein